MDRSELAHSPSDQHSEADVTDDRALAQSRDTGGLDRDGSTAGDEDGISTTGVDETGEFVGRVAGDDAGFAGETGAERRAQG
ncbi:hypothetical protein ACVGOW_17935 [Pseudonocardia saturnea]